MKRYPRFRMVTFSMSLSDININFKVKILFNVKSLEKGTTPYSATLNDAYPHFKVTPLFHAEYLRNGTRYRRSFKRILIGTYTRPTQQCHFEWPWVTLSDLAKYSMTRSVTQSVCDSWASCLRKPRCCVRQTDRQTNQQTNRKTSPSPKAMLRAAGA